MVTVTALAVMSAVGYLVVGVAASIVVAAIDHSSVNGKADSFDVVGAAVFWPVALIVGLFYGARKMLAPAGRRLCRGWTRLVLCLNPDYKGME